jgi:WD40 repeat protein
MDTGHLQATWKLANGGVHAVAFTPDGRAIAIGGGDGTVRLWDPAAEREIVMLRGHARDVVSLDISPDGRILAFADVDGHLSITDLSHFFAPQPNR